MDSATRCRLRVQVDASPCRPGRASASGLPSSGPALGDGHLLPAEAVRPSARPTGPAQDLYAPTGSASQPWRVGAGASTCPHRKHLPAPEAGPSPPQKRAPARSGSTCPPRKWAPARPGSEPLRAPEGSPCPHRKGAPAHPGSTCPPRKRAPVRPGSTRPPRKRAPAHPGREPLPPRKRAPAHAAHRSVCPARSQGRPPAGLRGEVRSGGLGDLQDAGCTPCARSGSTVGREGCWRSGRDEEITSTLCHRGEGLCASVRSLTSYFLVQFIILSLKKRFCILNAAFGS